MTTIADPKPIAAAEHPPSLRPGKIPKIVVALFVVVPTTFGLLLLDADHNLIEAGGYSIGLLAFYLYRWHRRSAQMRRNKTARAMIDDPRGFILYLRSFITSRRLTVRNTLPSVLDRLLVGRYWDAELALEFGFEGQCAMLAIGDKGNSYGAAKITSDDKDWKQLLEVLVDRCRCIFVVPLATPGTLYELVFLTADPTRIRKTIFVMPPTYFSWSALFSFISGHSHRRRWRQARATLAEKKIEIPAYSRKGCLFLLDEQGHCIRTFSTGGFDGRYLDELTGQIRAAAAGGGGYEARINEIKISPPSRLGAKRMWVAIASSLTPPIPFVMTTLLILVPVRAFLFQPFDISSGSMKPTLLVGDQFFVSKYSYGYSRYSLPLSPSSSGRIWASEPERGDVVVFRAPHGRFSQFSRTCRRSSGRPDPDDWRCSQHQRPAGQARTHRGLHRD